MVVEGVEDVESIMCIGPVVQWRSEHPIEHQQLVIVEVDFRKTAVHGSRSQVPARTEIPADLGGQYVGGFSLGLCLPFLVRDDFSKHHRQRASVVVVVHVVKHEPKRSPIPRVGLVRFNVIEVDFNPGVGALPTSG